MKANPLTDNVKITVRKPESEATFAASECSAKRTEKPIEYYVNRNAIFECVAVVGWWCVAFLILAMILARL